MGGVYKIFRGTELSKSGAMWPAASIQSSSCQGNTDAAVVLMNYDILQPNPASRVTLKRGTNFANPNEYIKIISDIKRE